MHLLQFVSDARTGNVALFILNPGNLFKCFTFKDDLAESTAQFHRISLNSTQDGAGKNGDFRQFRGALFRINISMFISNLIFVRFPVHFIQDIFESSLLGFGPCISVPKNI